MSRILSFAVVLVSVLSIAHADPIPNGFVGATVTLSTTSFMRENRFRHDGKPMFKKEVLNFPSPVMTGYVLGVEVQRLVEFFAV